MDMKKTVLAILMLCAAVVAQAQVSESGNWYDGDLCYSAKNMAGGKVLMNATAEGEELEFMLVPVAGKKDTYTVADGPNDYLNLFENIATVRHQKRDGLDALCFYDSDNLLQTVMSNETEWDAQKLNIARFKEQIVGKYEQKGGPSELIIEWDKIIDNSVPANYEVETFNGLVMGYITVVPDDAKRNHRLQGTWEIVFTLDGLVLYSLTLNEDYGAGFWQRDGVNQIEFHKSSPDESRFAYAGAILLNDRRFRWMSGSTLRIMRNEIMARHGYRFQSKDLQEYFSSMPWYKPAASNDEVKLSFIERLNVELIKAVENDPYHDDYVTEPQQ